MPKTVKELQAERAPIGAEIRKQADKVSDEKRDFTAEEKVAWDRANADFNRLTSQIDVARRAEEVGEVLGRGHPSPPGAEDTPPREGRSGKAGRRADAGRAEELRALAFQAWARRQHGLDLTRDQRRACRLTGLNPNRRSVTFDLPRRPGATEARALSVVTGSAGAVTVPQGFMANLEKALKDFNGVRQVADVMRTDSGNSMPWPTVNDTTNAGRIVGENATVNSLDPAFSSVTFGAWKYTSDLVLVPAELLDDTAFALGEELGPMLGERIGRAQEAHYTTGNGTTQPQGVVAAAALGKTAASATAIAADEIIDLIHSVDPAYRRDPSFALMMHDLVFGVVRKLKDSQNRYLFEEGQNGAPDRIKGVRVVINQNMASAVTTGQRTMLAGAFRKYKIRDVKQVRLRRLEERYADTDQTGFVAFFRSDGKLLNAGTNPVKYLAQA